MRKILSILMAVTLLSSMLMFNVSAQENVSVYIDGTKIEFDVQPQIINGRTLVPMRKIFEELGAVVDWDNTTQTAIGTKENMVVKFTINDYTMYKNESANTLDVPAQLIDGRTLIPLRAVSEAFDCHVDWDGNNSSVYISSKNSNFKKVSTYLKNNGFFKEGHYFIDEKNISLSYVEKENLISIYSTEDGYYELIMLISEDGEVTYHYIDTMFNMEMQGIFFADTLTDKEETLPYYSYNGSSQAETLINKQATIAIKIALIRTEQLFYENKPEFTIKDLGFLDVSNCFVPKENDSDYYPNSNVPTYTFVTGVSLKDTSVSEKGTIYKYDYTLVGEYNEFSDYVVYLLKEGWTQIDKSNDGKMLICYLMKNNVKVMVGYVATVDEIWISIF